MQVVECPHCQRKFKVPMPVTNARMKCSRCGQVFVGSSTESEDMVGVPTDLGVAAAPAAGAARPAQTERVVRPISGGRYGPLFLVVSVVGGVGVIVLLILLCYNLTHPKVIEKDASGRVVSQEKLSRDEVQRRVEKNRAEAEAARRQMTPRQPGDGTGSSAPRVGRDPTGLLDSQGGPTTGPARAALPDSDPKLQAGAPAKAPTSASEDSYAIGQVHSRYEVPLESLTVTLYYDGALVSSKSYAFIPAGGSVQYTVPARGTELEEGKMAVVVKGKPAPANVVVWQADSGEIRATREGTKFIWTGRTRNDSGVPVKDVKVYVDYFADDGVQGGSAVGELEDGNTIGAGKSASFRVVTDDLTSQASSKVIARVVGQKY